MFFFPHGFDFHESIRIPFYWHYEVTGPWNPINPVIFPLTILTIRDFMAPRSHLHQEIGGALDQSTAAGCMTAPQKSQESTAAPHIPFFWDTLPYETDWITDFRDWFCGCADKRLPICFVKPLVNGLIYTNRPQCDLKNHPFGGFQAIGVPKYFNL